MKKMYPLLLLCLTPFLSLAQNLPDVHFTDIKGNKHQLFDALDQGYIVFLDFAFVECVPCNEAIPEIKSIIQDYEAQNVLFWYISDRDEDESLINHLDSTGLELTACGIDGGGDAFIDAFTEQFSFFGFPTISIICPDRSITWDIWPYSDGAPEWRTVIDQCNPGIAEEAYEPIEISSTHETKRAPFAFQLQGGTFQGEGVVQAAAPYDTPLVINIYTMQGQYVKEVFNGWLKGGEHQLALRFRLPHTGSYLLQYQTSYNSGAQKIMYIK
jgi:hypothetical protein